MRRLLLLGLPAAAAVAIAAAPAGAATNECRGLQVCVPVAGPWVVLPTKRSVPRPQVQFQLSCPKGYIVGGTDAELSTRAIDVTFIGTMGAPVNPGISTSADAVFVGRYVGAGSVQPPSFRPHIGCMPTRGGGSRTPTAAIYPPGKPVVRHVKNALLHDGVSSYAASCAPGERLVDGWSTLAFGGPVPPALSMTSPIRLAQSTRGASVIVKAATSGAGLVPGTIALVQVGAVCAGGK